MLTPQNHSFTSNHRIESISQQLSKKVVHPDLHKADIYDRAAVAQWHSLGMKKLKPVHVKCHIS